MLFVARTTMESTKLMTTRTLLVHVATLRREQHEHSFHLITVPVNTKGKITLHIMFVLILYEKP